MAANNHARLVERLFAEGYTQGKNPAIFDEVIAGNLKFYDSSTSTALQGLEAFKKRDKTYLAAFPDKTAKIDQLILSGNDVVVRWTVKATHKGMLAGIAATGIKVNISGISVFTFSGDKIAEIHQAWDRLGLLEQLGQTKLAAALK